MARIMVEVKQMTRTENIQKENVRKDIHLLLHVLALLSWPDGRDCYKRVALDSLADDFDRSATLKGLRTDRITTA